MTRPGMSSPRALATSAAPAPMNESMIWLVMTRLTWPNSATLAGENGAATSVRYSLCTGSSMPASISLFFSPVS